MKHIVVLLVTLHYGLLIAEQEENLSPSDLGPKKDRNRAQIIEAKEREFQQIKGESSKLETKAQRTQKTKKNFPHEIGINGRSLFEDEIKNAFEARKKNSKLTREKSLQKAQDLWEQSQRSKIPAREFVMHLKDRYNNNTLHDVYSGQHLDFARKEFEADLKEISPFLYKTWRDSFFTKRRSSKIQVRTDVPFFAWLNENPQYLTFPEKENEPTPLEVACDGKSSEMAQKIIYIADVHEVSIKTLCEPLVEKYKIIYLTDGEGAAFDYLQSIYDLHIDELSRAMFESVKNIQF